MTLPPPGTPAAEYPITPALVHDLLCEQHPDLADLPLEEADSGWDNAMLRLGSDLAVRLPRRQLAVALIEHEQAWLPLLAASLPLPIPAPLRIGHPNAAYPWPWSVVPWLEGLPADQQPIHPDQAALFGQFLAALHTPAPANAPANPFRGVPLIERQSAMQQRIERLHELTDLLTPSLLAVWDRALQLPIDCAPTWLHGDLHPRNLLVQHGRISGVIDWGDLTAGDPATDLAGIWTLIAERQDRQVALAAYHALRPLTSTTLQRALAWAALFGVMHLDAGVIDSPRHTAIGRATLKRVLADLANAEP
jgi:aminoglycoside phosphotransferase (APT) family kinase protein